MSIVRVRSHLRVNSIIVMLLLLCGWNGVRIEPTSAASIFTRYDTNLLAVLVDVPRAIPLHLFQRWILRSKQRKAAIVVAATRERIVAALELARHLLIGGATARHQHHVKTRKSEDWNR